MTTNDDDTTMKHNHNTLQEEANDDDDHEIVMEGPTSNSTGTSSLVDGNSSNESHHSTTTKQKLIVLKKKLCAIYWEHEILLLIIISILLAKAYPPLGATYVKPDITATWIAVIIIFLLAGITLKTSEFTKAFANWQYNMIIQLYNFGVVSAIAFGISRLLIVTNIISNDLADGMVVCSCMPMTISMVVVLTKTANGDEASSIFNSACGNLIGVFLSPLLILGYLGVTGDIDLVRVFYQLILRVIVPGIIGQILQKNTYVNQFVSQHKFILKQLQTYTLIFIVYTIFCETFTSDTGSTISDIFLMILFQLITLSIVMILAWYMLRLFFTNYPKLRVAGLYCCTHKTIAIGIPLITAIYSDSPTTASKVGLYTLPLLIWHPLQLIIGTVLAPELAKFVKKEETRLQETSNNNRTDGSDIHHSQLTPHGGDVEEGRR